MIKKIIALSVLVGFIGLSQSAFVYAQDVYMTKNGQKYHKEDCRLIQKKNPQKIDKAQAVEKQLEPCGRCFKEDLSKAISESIQHKVKAKNK